MLCVSGVFWQCCLWRGRGWGRNLVDDIIGYRNIFKPIISKIFFYESPSPTWYLNYIFSSKNVDNICSVLFFPFWIHCLWDIWALSVVFSSWMCCFLSEWTRDNELCFAVHWDLTQAHCSRSLVDLNPAQTYTHIHKHCVIRWELCKVCLPVCSTILINILLHGCHLE